MTSDQETKRATSDNDVLKKLLQDEIERCMLWSRKYRKLWSFVTHGATAFVICGSAITTLLQVLKTSPQVAVGISLTVTAIAATQLAFRQK
ncbi:MAG TPA: hypothetical protein VGN61_12485, partial [Verrucomicrobiae bacterium]